jgi:esterase/lipase superfamily enzyme
MAWAVPDGAAPRFLSAPREANATIVKLMLLRKSRLKARLGTLVVGTLVALAACSFPGNIPASAAEVEIIAHDTYAVTNVDPGDALKIRRAPNPGAPALGSIPANAKGIVASGGVKKIKGSTWAQIHYQDLVGWVNTGFLVEDDQSLTNREELYRAGISIKLLDADFHLDPAFLGAVGEQPNKCPEGDERVEVSISNEMLAYFQGRGFSLETLCLAITTRMRYDPESGVPLPSAKIGEYVWVHTNVPDCFKNGTPFLDCSIKYHWYWRGSEDAQAYHTEGVQIDAAMHKALDSGVSLPQFLGKEDFAKLVDPNLDVFGDSPEGGVEFIEVSHDLPRGYAYRIKTGLLAFDTTEEEQRQNDKKREKQTITTIDMKTAVPWNDHGQVTVQRQQIPSISFDQANPNIDRSKFKALQPVFFATNRKIEGGPALYTITAEHSTETKYGLAIISVPKTHTIGHVQTNSWFFGLFHSEEKDEEDFRIQGLSLLGHDEIVDKLKHAADSVLVFVHGYNVSFADALYKAAQIAYDSNFQGSVIVFSWPAAGSLRKYDYDYQSALFSPGALLGVLKLLTEEIGKKKLLIVAHSLGNQVLVDALQQAALSQTKLDISELVLAAPDVDRDVFLSKESQVKSVAGNITLYASSTDKALLASSKKTWGTRLGYIGDHGPFIANGIETIDISAIGNDIFGLNHGTFSDNRTMLDDLGRIINSGIHPPGVRTPTLRYMPEAHPEYWMYPQ